MDIEQIIDSMTPEVYQRLATAVELGKWPDGVALTPEQKEANRQAARRVAWQILERAAAEGRLPAASN